MNKQTAARYQQVCIGLIMAFAVGSILSGWLGEQFDLSGKTIRIGSQIALLIAAAGYFYFRKKAK